MTPGLTVAQQAELLSDMVKERQRADRRRLQQEPLAAAIAVIDKLWDARYALVGDTPGYNEGYLDGIEHAARVVRELADGAS